MTEYQFTKDWFNWAPEVWNQLIPMLPDNPKVMEIGSFEGRSAVWIIENMLGEEGELLCIDTWEGGEEHSNGELDGAEERFDLNRELAMAKKGWRTDDQWGPKGVGKMKGKSFNILCGLVGDNDADFDFIYIDGSHKAPDVLTDTCMSWPLLKAGGLMVFDDYMWGNPRDALHRPKIAIDAFTNIFGETVEIIHVGYQLVVRKKG
jgi:predicted O-methyltransferase YrrM